MIEIMVWPDKCTKPAMCELVGLEPVSYRRSQESGVAAFKTKCYASSISTAVRNVK